MSHSDWLSHRHTGAHASDRLVCPHQPAPVFTPCLSRTGRVTATRVTMHQTTEVVPHQPAPVFTPSLTLAAQGTARWVLMHHRPSVYSSTPTSSVDQTGIDRERLATLHRACHISRHNTSPTCVVACLDSGLPPASLKLYGRGYHLSAPGRPSRGCPPYHTLTA